MKNKLVMVGKRMKQSDGRSLRGLDPEIIVLINQVLKMYGISGTKLVLSAVAEGKLKPKF